MAQLLCRPIRNVVKSWNTNGFDKIDDAVTYPNIGGTSDYTEADKNDDNEIEKYELTSIQHAVVTEVSIYLLANSSYTSLQLKGGYDIGGSVSGLTTWNIPATGYAWVTNTWTGLSIPMNLQNNIRIGCGTMSSGDSIYVAVAYLLITYSLGSYGSIQGGAIQGGTIQ